MNADRSLSLRHRHGAAWDRIDVPLTDKPCDWGAFARVAGVVLGVVVFWVGLYVAVRAWL